MLPSRVFNAARGSKAGKETRIDGKKCGIPKKMWNYYSLTWGYINTGGAVSQVSAVEWSFKKASRLYRSFAYIRLFKCIPYCPTTKSLTRFCSSHQNERVVQQNRRPKWATGEWRRLHCKALCCVFGKILTRCGFGPPMAWELTHVAFHKLLLQYPANFRAAWAAHGKIASKKDRNKHLLTWTVCILYLVRVYVKEK